MHRLFKFEIENIFNEQNLIIILFKYHFEIVEYVSGYEVIYDNLGYGISDRLTEIFDKISIRGPESIKKFKITYTTTDDYILVSFSISIYWFEIKLNLKINIDDTLIAEDKNIQSKIFRKLFDLKINQLKNTKELFELD